MKQLSIVLAAALAVTGIAVSAQESQESQGQQEEPKKEKKICRTERATGSLTRRTRICMTEAQWRELNSRTRRGVDEMNSAASGGKMCVPDPADPFQGCPG
jgi:hypothetical protein